MSDAVKFIAGVIVALVALGLMGLGGFALYTSADNNRQKVERITTTCVENGHVGAADISTGFVCLG